MGFPHPGPHTCCREAPGVGRWCRQGGLSFALSSIHSFSFVFFPPAWQVFPQPDGIQAALSYFKGKNMRPISAQVNCNYTAPSFFAPMTPFNLYISSCSLATRLSRSFTCSHLTQFWQLPYNAHDCEDPEPQMQIHRSHRKLMINLLISSLLCYQFLTWKDLWGETP